MPGRPDEDRPDNNGPDSDDYSPPDPLAVMRDAFEHGYGTPRQDQERHPTRFGRRRRSAPEPAPAPEPEAPQTPAAPAPRPASERPGWSYSGPPAPVMRSDAPAEPDPEHAAPESFRPPEPVIAEPIEPATPPAPKPVAAQPVTVEPPVVEPVAVAPVTPPTPESVVPPAAAATPPPEQPTTDNLDWLGNGSWPAPAPIEQSEPIEQVASTERSKPVLSAESSTSQPSTVAPEPVVPPVVEGASEITDPPASTSTSPSAATGSPNEVAVDWLSSHLYGDTPTPAAEAKAPAKDDTSALPAPVAPPAVDESETPKTDSDEVAVARPEPKEKRGLFGRRGKKDRSTTADPQTSSPKLTPTPASAEPAVAPPAPEPVETTQADTPAEPKAAQPYDWLNGALPDGEPAESVQPSQVTETTEANHPEEPKPATPVADEAPAPAASFKTDVPKVETSTSPVPEPPQKKRGLFSRRQPKPESDAPYADSMTEWLAAGTPPPPAPPGKADELETTPDLKPTVAAPPPGVNAGAKHAAPAPTPTTDTSTTGLIGAPPSGKTPSEPKTKTDTSSFGVPTFGGRHSVSKPPEIVGDLPKPPAPVADPPSKVSAAPTLPSVVPSPDDEESVDQIHGLTSEIVTEPPLQTVRSGKFTGEPVKPQSAKSTLSVDKPPEYVAFRQASTARSVLVGGCVIAGVAVAGAIAWQVLRPGQTPLTALMAACGVLLLFLIGLLMVKPGILSVTDGLVEFAKGSHVEHLDLNSKDLNVEASESPDSENWSVKLAGSGKEMVVDRSQVDVEEFLEILTYFQANHTA